MLRIVPAGESSSIFFMMSLGERDPILTDAAGSDDNVVHPAAVTRGFAGSVMAIARPPPFYAVLLSPLGYYCGPAPNPKPLVAHTGWMKLV